MCDSRITRESAMASCMCTCGVNSACERASTVAPGVHSAAQSPAGGAAPTLAFLAGVFKWRAIQERFLTPNAMAIPSQKYISRAPLDTEGHCQAAYNQNTTSALATVNLASHQRGRAFGQRGKDKKKYPTTPLRNSGMDLTPWPFQEKRALVRAFRNTWQITKNDVLSFCIPYRFHT